MDTDQNLYGFYSTKLWDLFKTKTDNDTAFRFTVEQVCRCATDLCYTITQFFPAYTIHDGRHITGVCNWIYKLLGDSAANNLSESEAALLLMSACCHDIGMAVDKEQKTVFVSTLRIKSEEEMREYVRQNHHSRVREQLNKYFDRKVWNETIMARKCITKEMLAGLCKSHGEELTPLNSPLPEFINLNICAVLLRLSDALDYDSNRAPEVLVKFLGLEDPKTESEITSLVEHKKTGTGEFSYKKGYPIRLVGSCNDREVYNELSGYIKWLDAELLKCNEFISNYASNWKGILPTRVTDNLDKQFSSKALDNKQSNSSNVDIFNLNGIKECIDGLISWVSSFQCHWGAFNKSKTRKIANTAEGLLAFKITGYDKKKIAIYKDAITSLISEANEKGWQSITLNKETTQCTALSLLLFSLEKEKPSGTLTEGMINYNAINRIADILWDSRNHSNGWGHYVEPSDEDACNYVYSAWTLIALSKYEAIANTSVFADYCQLFYERSIEGKFGYYDSGDPKLISTGLFVCLYYSLPVKLKKRIRRGYNIKEALAFLLDQTVNYNVMVEAMTHFEDDDNSVTKAPWYNITISVVLSALSLAYSNGDLHGEQWSSLKEYVCKRVVATVHNTQAGKYYLPQGLPDQPRKIYTYPSFHLIWGLQMLLNAEEKGRIFTKKISALEAVMNAVNTRTSLFSVSEIADRCPQFALRTVHHSINSLCKQGIIEKIPQGRVAKYILKSVANVLPDISEKNGNESKVEKISLKSSEKVEGNNLFKATSDLYDALALFRESIKTANEDKINESSRRMESIVREIYLLYEYYLGFDEAIASKANRLVSQYNSFVEPYCAFVKSKNRMSNIAQEHAKTAETAFNALMRTTLDVLQQNNETPSK